MNPIQVVLNDLMQATVMTLRHLKGTWGILAIDRENPHQMLVARNGSPLLVGIHPDHIYIASERIAFEKYTQNYVALEDGEVILLDLHHRSKLSTLMHSRVSVIKER